MATPLSTTEIMAAAIDGPCTLELRDPRDGRPARLQLTATATGYAVRVETGMIDDGTDSLREVSTIERAAAIAAISIASLLRAGYRPLRLERLDTRHS